MKFKVSRESLLKPLQVASGVVEKKQTMPVLANVLLVLNGEELSITGTDLEVEIIGKIRLEEASARDGEITVPAKKLVDICRALPEKSVLSFVIEEERLVVRCGKSRFTLSTLSASEFPSVESGDNEIVFTTQQDAIKTLIDKTSFAMAQQDVRYYLNGMLWEIRQGMLRVVATDGHRLAMSHVHVNIPVEDVKQAILPRKGVIELARLLQEGESNVEIIIGSNHLRAVTKDFVFTSKLVEGQFPDYERVIPSGGDKIVIGNREELRQAFARTFILSNEKYRGVRVLLDQNQLTLIANNPEQEEAEDQVLVDYSGESLEVGFNVSYLQDVANVLDTENIKITLSNSNSSALIEEPENSSVAYVVMPMRL